MYDGTAWRITLYTHACRAHFENEKASLVRAICLWVYTLHCVLPQVHTALSKGSDLRLRFHSAPWLKTFSTRPVPDALMDARMVIERL